MCHQPWHPSCAGVSKSTALSLSNDTSSWWACPKCRDIPGVSLLLSFLEKEKADKVEMKNRINVLESRVQSLILKSDALCSIQDRLLNLETGLSVAQPLVKTATNCDLIKQPTKSSPIRKRRRLKVKRSTIDNSVQLNTQVICPNAEVEDDAGQYALPEKSNVNPNKELLKEKESNTAQNSCPIEQFSEDLRKKTLVLLGVPESDSSDPKIRLKADIDFLQTCLGKVIPAEKNFTIRKVFRVRPRQPNSQFPRLLKVILDCAGDRDLILSRCFLLKGLYPKISVQKDLTLAERQAHKSLVGELKNRTAAGEVGLKIKNGKIVQPQRSFLWTNPLILVRT
jgi:hypothetical protein